MAKEKAKDGEWAKEDDEDVCSERNQRVAPNRAVEINEGSADQQNRGHRHSAQADLASDRHGALSLSLSLSTDKKKEEYDGTVTKKKKKKKKTETMKRQRNIQSNLIMLKL